MYNSQNPREIALKIVYRINENKTFSNISLNKEFKRNRINLIDRGLITEIVYGTIRWQGKLDWIINQFVKVKNNKMDKWLRNILRLGTYQIIFLDKIPDYAICNESVKLAKKYTNKTKSSFVNAVLRTIIRNSNKINLPNKNENLNLWISVNYSHPLWIVDKWIKDYGNKTTAEICKSNNKPPRFTIRVNTLKTNIELLKNKLTEERVFFHESYLDNSLEIKKLSTLEDIKSFNDGLFQPQSESSILTSLILDPKPNEKILDACAGPGGKTTHIAEIMGNKGKVIAWDIYQHKIKLIDRLAKKMDVNIIETELKDSSITDESMFNEFDRILIDAPCSGTGIIRNKPEIKWFRQKNDINSLVKIQQKIINTVSKYLKSGGFLVYSTCSIEREENEDIIHDFLKKNNNFNISRVDESLLNFNEIITKDGFIKILPNYNKLEGFFISKLQKK